MKRDTQTFRSCVNVILIAVSVNLVGCGGGGQSGGGGQQSPPDFSLSLSSNSLSLTAGTSASVTVSVNGTNGFASAVTLQISGLPTGVTYSPSTPQVNPGSSLQVTFTAAARSAASQENVTVTGITGNLSYGAPLNLTVTAISNSSATVLFQVSPSRVMVGVPQGILQLAGMNFTPSSSVLFDGAPANATLGSSTAIEVFVDSSIFGIAKLHTVQVSDPTNGNSNVLTYDVYSPQGGPLPFAGQQTLPLDQNATDTATWVDVNGDGRSDLVTFDTPYGTNTVQMSIQFGNEDGTLSAPVVNNVAIAGGMPEEVLAGDLKANGHKDLILIDPSSYRVC